VDVVGEGGILDGVFEVKYYEEGMIVNASQGSIVSVCMKAKVAMSCQ
jgi:hypothetical protein